MAAEGRSWVIELPPGTPILTANERASSWRATMGRNKRTQELKAIVRRLAADVAKVPALRVARVEVVYLNPPRLKKDRHPLASARIEDHDNLWPTWKATTDALVKAQVLADDNARRVMPPVCRIGGMHPRGQVRIIITEVGGDAQCLANSPP